MQKEQFGPLDRVKLLMYYFIIGIVSFVALVFLPMIGTQVGLGWNIPNTVVGWIVWVAVKVIVAGLNVLIFYSFMQQAKLNIKDNDRYKEAQDILCKVKVKEYIPRSPNVWNKQQYSRKGVCIFFTTALATVALTQAILTFDWVSMLTYLFTIIMGVIFGILQMKSAEDYWTDEFWKYAKMVQMQTDAQNTPKSNDSDQTEEVIEKQAIVENKPIVEPENEAETINTEINKE